MPGERQPTWESTYEEYGRKLLEPYGTPGASVAIAEDGRMTYHHGFGYRDAEERLPITPDTVFGIGSITKSFTAMCIMQLQEAGKLSVHDPVVRHLPEFRTPDPELTRRMTIHHFLTHTSGLPPLPSLMRALARSMREDPDVDQPEVRKRIEEAEPVDTYEQLMECIAKTEFELLGPPGEFFSYSNDAYALLGAIVARASGQPFPEYLRQHILEPAGMTSTTMDVPEGPAFPDVSSLYIEKEKDGKERIVKSPLWWQAPGMDAAGFLRSSARDMLRYLEIYRTGGRVGDRRILSEESVREMTAPRVQVGPKMHYGYGLMITPDYHGVTLVEHGGNIKGVSAYVSVVPERGWTGVALTNLISSPGGQLLLAAWNLRLGLPVDTCREAFVDYVCPAERLAEYAGLYVSGEGASIRLTPKDGGLDCEMEGKHYRARPVGEDAFAVRIKALDSYMRFFRDGHGAVYAVAFGFRMIRRVAEASRTETA